METLSPDPEPRRARPSDRTFAILVTAGFFALCVFDVWRHVMWRDELRVWQICAASPTWDDLRQNMQYDGVPIVWFAIVWTLTQWTTSPFSMQLAHAAIATVVTWVFVRHAPFGRVIKILFPLGYFPFFEYATISRNYALLSLGVMLAAHFISNPVARPLRLALLLAVLAHVSIWGAAFAALFLFAAAVRWIGGSEPGSRGGVVSWIVATFIVFFSIAWCYTSVVPGPGGTFLGGWTQETTPAGKVLGTIGSAWKALAPIPQIRRQFWNTNILDGVPVLEAAAGAVALLLATLLLLRRPAALVLFILGALGLLVFAYTQFAGSVRHHGQLFLIFIAACWIANGANVWNLRPHFVNAAIAWIDGRRRQILLGILALHALCGIGANVVDTVLPFSASRATAEYIRTHVAPDTPLVGYPDFCVTPITAWLGRNFYFPEMLSEASFNTQDDRARVMIDKEVAIAEAAAVSKRSKKREALLVVMGLRTLDHHSPIVKVEIVHGQPPEPFTVEVLPKFMNATVREEVYALYLIRPATVSPSP